MLCKVLSIMILAAVATSLPGDPVGNEFSAPSAIDQRSPCPYLNTLANHGFIQRDGFNVSRAEINDAFDVAFNIDPAITDPIITTALTGTTSVVPDTLNLNDLNTHGLIEHDGSLSRDDIDVGNNAVFDAAIWDTVMANFPDATISLAQMALARAGRLATAEAANPSFNFTPQIETVSLAEIGLVMQTFADGGTEGGASTQQVDTFFREERVPFDQGFVRPATRITTESLGTVSAALAVPPAVRASFFSVDKAMMLTVEKA